MAGRDPAEVATNMHVNFNYQVDAAGNLRAEQSFPVTSLVEYRLGGLDFSIARLGGNPGATFGFTQVSTTDAAVGDMMCIMGHPAGWPKRIEAGPCVGLSGNSISYDDIDTLGGNSGSGILRATDGRIVGVHTNGGCNAAGTGANSGVRITSIVAQSPTLQALTTPKLKFTDDPKLKFRDDHGTIKSLDDHATLKFLDDHGTLKALDDHGTLKALDDINTLKFRDDGGTSPVLDAPTTHKATDDVKQPGLDKQFSDHKVPAQDGAMPPGFGGRPGWRGGGAAPFVLSTPHHSMAWSRREAGGAAMTSEVLGQYEAALAQMESAMQQGLDQLAALDAEYRNLLAEYEQVARG